MASRQSWKNERKSPSRYGNRLKTDILSYFQLWRLAILEPVGVQIHNVPHFKGLIVLYLDLRSSRAWHHFYYWPRPLEKSHFIPVNGVCTVCFFHHCNMCCQQHLLMTLLRHLKNCPFRQPCLSSGEGAAIRRPPSVASSTTSQKRPTASSSRTGSRQGMQSKTMNASMSIWQIQSTLKRGEMVQVN